MSDAVIIQSEIENEAFVHSQFYGTAKDEILSILADYHNRFPLKKGLLKEELRSKMGGNIKEKLFNQVIDDLIREAAIVREKETIRRKEHKIELLQDQEELRSEIEEVYLKSGLEPPYFRDLDQNKIDRGAKDLLEIMVKDGILIKVKEDLYFHKKAIEGLRGRLVDFIKQQGEIITPQLKEITGVSRKYTIPLIEYFDKIQLTVRIGDKRILRKRQ